MRRNTKIAIGPIAFILILVVFTIHHVISSKVELNSPLAIGNTAGNIYNGGYFSELNGTVYFSDTQNGSTLCSMNTDESDVKLLGTSNVRNVMAYGKYVYYYMDSNRNVEGKGLNHFTNQYGIFRIDTSGKNIVCLAREYAGKMQLCGNYIYYQVPNGNSSYIAKIKIDKSEAATTVMNDQIIPACYSNGLLYYSGFLKDLAIHTLNTQNNDQDTLLYDGYYYMPIIQDGYLYYMDAGDDYHLYRRDMVTNTVEQLTSERIDTYNLDNNYIFYAASVESQTLHRMNLDGTDDRIFFQGICNSLNLTSEYLYFKIYGDDASMYHLPIDGSAPASLFITN